jgi:predicted amidophosphoribosyltransferase
LKVALKQLFGPWDHGWALDKHMLSSTYLGEDKNGHARFDNVRTEVGEATYQLKYKHDWNQVEPLARSLADNIYPKLANVGFIVPMPASTIRSRQPVTEIAEALGKIIGKPTFADILLKANNGKALKDLNTKAEKMEAIGSSFSVNDGIDGNGPWNVLVFDDLFHTGASMEAACNVLRTYSKVRKIYIATLTWR